MKHKIKILITDDHPVFRRGLCSIIEAEPDFEITGEAENGENALKSIEANIPDIAILDVDMPVLDGIETAKLIRERFPQVKTVFLTLHKDKQVLNSLKKLHVQGYLLKDSAIVEVVNCIKQVVDGNTFISPEVLEMLLHVSEQGFSENPPGFSLSNLTPAEKRILRAVAESKTTKEIADDFFISLRTAENHRANICTKLHLRGNNSLIKFAFANKKMILHETDK